MRLGCSATCTDTDGIEEIRGHSSTADSKLERSEANLV